jgi:Glyoxalase/Bleomycin resistance protein/Dioxygenase superfamily
MINSTGLATPLGPVGQIGIVVPDIRAMEARYERTFGIDSWLRYTYTPSVVPHLEFRGAPGVFSVHLALGGTDPQIELLEPVAGPSVYHEHLDTVGAGLHHLGVFVDSLDQAIATMTGLGYDPVQLGRGYGLDGDGGFAYFDTARDYHVMLEAIEVPSRRRPGRPDWSETMTLLEETT